MRKCGGICLFYTLDSFWRYFYLLIYKHVRGVVYYKHCSVSPCFRWSPVNNCFAKQYFGNIILFREVYLLGKISDTRLRTIVFDPTFFGTRLHKGHTRDILIPESWLLYIIRKLGFWYTRKFKILLPNADKNYCHPTRWFFFTYTRYTAVQFTHLGFENPNCCFSCLGSLHVLSEHQLFRRISVFFIY